MPKALVIDDDKNVRLTMELILESEGFDVTLADNVKSALSITENDDFDILVVDLVMPELSGIDMVYSFRETNLRTPILMISGGFKNSEIPQKQLEGALEEKPIKMLKKPFTNQEFNDSIKELLNS